MKKIILSSLLCCPFFVNAQESQLQQSYRSIVAEYNQDIKAAGYHTALKNEMQKSAKADFLPHLSGGANFNYTGNPTQLSIRPPGAASPLHVEGKNSRYGVSLTLLQPVYTGGALQAAYQKAQKETEMAQHETERITNYMVYNADVHYWNAVAQQEMLGVARSFRNSVKQLTQVVKHRVEVEYIDRNDLLMSEVKLNDADYQLLHTKNQTEVARLALNSFAGIDFDKQIPIDTVVAALTLSAELKQDIENNMASRPEIQIAQNQVDLGMLNKKISNARFMPQIHVGIDGSYSSPGYDFTADMNPNYAIYAQLNIPLFEWGKRKNTRKAATFGINMAKENQSKVTDHIQLEIETAYYSYAQSVQKVNLTGSSLKKAQESEQLSMERYKEGSISIVEVINAQLYHQQAQINHIQSKLNAQIAKSDFERAVGRFKK